MEYEKKEFLTYQQGKTVTDQFYIDDDYNVPDTKSDVKKVILSEGSLQIEDMKEVENYIKISGKLQFKVLYVTDEGDDRMAALEGRLPFEEMVYLDEPLKGSPFIKASNADLTVTMIHSRKLNIKTLAEILICSEGKEETHLTMDVENGDTLYKKSDTCNILRLFTIKKDTYRIKEEVSIGGMKENIGNLLWSEVSSRKLDTRMSENEVLLQGELLLFCLYESVEGKLDWITQTIPYEGKLECYGANDSMFHQIYPVLSDVVFDVRMDEDGEMRLIGVEATLEARMIVYVEEEMKVLKDVYSLSHNCVPKVQKREMERLLMQNHSKCKVNEQLSLPEIQDDILQICHSTGKIQVEHTEVTDRGIQMEGVLHVSFLYIKSDDAVPFDVWQGMVPFSYLLESNETCEDMSYDLTHFVEQLSIGLLGNGEVEVKAVLAFNSFLKEPVSIQNIEEINYEPINMEEVERRPGIVGYIVKDGDELWNLAKRYNTTVEGIMEVNDMEREEVKPGDKILIFKENMSIL